MADIVEVPGMPFPLRWLGDPAEMSIDGSSLRLTAPARTDRFADPGGTAVMDDAPALLADVSGAGDYQLSAQVTVDFVSDYDAGVLLLWAAPASYAKFCFEYSPQREAMAVSVVTRGVSDDANGFTVDSNTLWLRISKLGRAYAFHASVDGARWSFVRHFDLGADGNVELGFQAQSPVGDGCTATFSDITFAATTLVDLRDGS